MLILLAYEVFDDVAFYYMLCSIVALFLFPMAIWKTVSFIKYLRSSSRPLLTLSSSSIPHPDDLTTGLPCQCPQCRQKKQLLLMAKQDFRSYITVSNIIFVCLLIFFLLLLTQLSSYNQSPLASYDPYQILGLSSGADAGEIKRAYRQLSLKWHPDKNVDNAQEAERQFISITKAYQTLTSPQAQENIAKYGNPDGYQGISVTIGLPSILTKKENELRILFIYFLIFLVFPPVIVFLWWRRVKDFAENGVLVQSLRYYLRLIKSNATVKSLIEVLSISEEYSSITSLATSSASPQQFYADYVSLYGLVKDSMVKQTVFDRSGIKDPSKSKISPKYRYVHIVSVLYHAYLQRIPIPTSLQPVMNHVLKFAHLLLNSMLEATLQLQFLLPPTHVIQLMQLITQALWVDSSPLLQLPYMDDNLIKSLAKKNIKSIHSLRKWPMEKRLKNIIELTEKQWKEIDLVCDLFPDLIVSATAAVEDEEDVYENDIVVVRAQLQRLAFDPDREESKGREQLEQEEEAEEEGKEEDGNTKTNSNNTANSNNSQNDHHEEKSQMKSKKLKFSKKKKKEADPVAVNNDLKKKAESSTTTAATTTAAATTTTTTTPNSSHGEKEDSIISPTATTPTRKADIQLDDSSLSSDKLADLVPIPAATKRSATDIPPPLVHSPYFPHEKREKWVCFLFEMDPSNNRKLRQRIDFARVPAFTSNQTVELRFKAPPVERGGSEGWQQRDYTLLFMCDSYVGCDRSASLSLKIKKMRKVDNNQSNGQQQEEKSGLNSNGQNGDSSLSSPDSTAVFAAEEDKSWLESLLHPGPDYVGKWYYFGLASFWELALNVVVLSLLCLFIFNYLHSRGYWQLYFQPIIDTVITFVQPLTSALAPFISPVATPVMSSLTAVYAFIHSKLHVPPPPPLRRKKGRGGRVDRIPLDEEDDEEMIIRKREAEEKRRGEQIPGMGIDDTEEESTETQ